MSKKRITIPVFIPHTGCPHRCIFCNQWRVTGVSALPDRNSVENTIAKYLSKISPDIERVELAFFGGSFTGIEQNIQEQYLSWVKPYIEKGIISSIRVSTRPDYINRTTLDLLKRFNVETVELGVQSFSDDVLVASNRGHRAEDSISAIKLLKEYRFRTGIQLLPGLPLDTFEKSIKSAEMAVSLKPDDVRLYPAVVLRDTKLQKLYAAGEFSPMTIEATVELCSIMYGMFYEKGINVIRMGLHPMDIIDGDSPIVAGPYHPALGFMIKSRFRRKSLESLFCNWSSKNPGVKSAKLVIPEKNREEYIGIKKENILFIKDKFFLTDINYIFSEITEPFIQ